MFSYNQLVELLIVLSTAHNICNAACKVRSAFAHAQAKSGPVRPDTVPTGTLFTAFQLIACFLVPVGYILTVTLHGLQQPPWMRAFSLPDVVFGVRLEEGFLKYQLRVLAWAVGILGGIILDNAFNHLGDQYHPIGRREKPRIVQTGPYAWVRHPLYSLALLQGIHQTISFWSYIPLFTFVASAGLFAIKINIEEEIIQRDEAMKTEYRAYMRKVPARLVPYVW